MRSSRSKRTALATALLAAAAVAALSAHRRDEYLQAARLAIEPDRVELQLDLTPGMALAGAVIAEIDRDRSGTISEAEARAYAGVVQRETHLALDGRRLDARLVESQAPAVEAMTNGLGTFHLRWTASLPALTPGAHQLQFTNTHHTDIGVYLANVLVPSNDRVVVTAQDRDIDQRQFTVGYRLSPAPRRDRRQLLLAALAGAVAAFAVLLGRSVVR